MKIFYETIFLYLLTLSFSAASRSSLTFWYSLISNSSSSSLSDSLLVFSLFSLSSLQIFYKCQYITLLDQKTNILLRFIIWGSISEIQIISILREWINRFLLLLSFLIIIRSFYILITFLTFTFISFSE